MIVRQCSHKSQYKQHLRNKQADCQLMFQCEQSLRRKSEGAHICSGKDKAHTDDITSHTDGIDPRKKLWEGQGRNSNHQRGRRTKQAQFATTHRPRLHLFSKVALITLTLQYYLNFAQIIVQEIYFCNSYHYRSKVFKGEDINLPFHVKDYQNTVCKNSFQH